MAVSVNDVAAWFVQNDYDYPRDTRTGNMKLQKLLYFSQLVHLAKYDSPLFNAQIKAFRDGSVVECIRQEYHHRHNSFIQSMYDSTPRFTEEVMDTIETVVYLFGDSTAQELSDLNHEHQSWKESYEGSKSGGYAWSDRADITIEQMYKNEVEMIREIVSACNDGSEYYQYVVTNGKKFFYNPHEISIDEKITRKLESFNGQDSAYTLAVNDGEIFIF